VDRVDRVSPATRDSPLRLATGPNPPPATELPHLSRWSPQVPPRSRRIGQGSGRLGGASQQTPRSTHALPVGDVAQPGGWSVRSVGREGSLPGRAGSRAGRWLRRDIDPGVL